MAAAFINGLILHNPADFVLPSGPESVSVHPGFDILKTGNKFIVKKNTTGMVSLSNLSQYIVYGKIWVLTGFHHDEIITAKRIPNGPVYAFDSCRLRSNLSDIVEIFHADIRGVYLLNVDWIDHSDGGEMPDINVILTSSRAPFLYQIPVLRYVTGVNNPQIRIDVVSLVSYLAKMGVIGHAVDEEYICRNAEVIKPELAQFNLHWLDKGM